MPLIQRFHPNLEENVEEEYVESEENEEADGVSREEEDDSTRNDTKNYVEGMLRIIRQIVLYSRPSKKAAKFKVNKEGAKTTKRQSTSFFGNTIVCMQV